MRISKKSDYALRALVALADVQEKTPVSMRQLAQENDIPFRFLQQIMLELREQGWVNTLPGRDGGVMLAQAPQAITMGQVVRHFDGVLAPVGCVSTTHYEGCSQEPVCRFRRTLLEIRNYTASLMDRTNLDMLLRDMPLAHAEVFDARFIDGAGI